MTGQTLITRRPETAELIVERTFAATPARLWRCWTTEEVTRWWEPHGWSAVVEEMDVRPGGTWRYSIAPDADPDVATDPPVLCGAVYGRVLFAGSAGCALALDAATALGDRVSGLYLYEPAFVVGPGRPPIPADYLDRLRGLLAQDKRDEAVELLMTEAIGVPAEYLEPMKADPSWARMVGYAHTIVHDAEILAGTQDGKPLPTDRWNIDAPVHVVVGENSEAFFHEGAQALVALLPNATYATLPGQDHSAFWMAPDSIAASVPGSLRTAAESASR